MRDEAKTPLYRLGVAGGVEDDVEELAAAVTKLGLKYADVADWSESIGRDRPSAMDPETRGNLLAYLMKPAGKSAVDAFSTATSSK